MLKPLDPLDRIKQRQQLKPQVLESDTASAGMEDFIRSNENAKAQLQSQMEAITRAEQTGQEGGNTTWGNMPQVGFDPGAEQGSVMGKSVGITQAYGVKNPGVEVFSKDGINRGVDFGVKEGTPLALPPGEWQVLEAFGEASGRGKIGNNTNRGYGNSILVKNTKTGEFMRFSHLQAIANGIQPGVTLRGGTVFGRSGATGNVTGPHLDLEYIDAKGNYQDVMKSAYANSLFE